MKKMFVIGVFGILLWSNEALSQITVSGMVIEITTGEPISGATIFVNDEYNIAIYPPLRTVTNNEGLYELKLPNGKYHIGVYSYYEAEGDTFALAYEPGVFSLPDSMIQVFEEHTVEIDFALSKLEFEERYSRKQQNNSFFDEMITTEMMQYDRKWKLLRSRVASNFPHFFEEDPITFIQQKSW